MEGVSLFLLASDQSCHSPFFFLPRDLPLASIDAPPPYAFCPLRARSSRAFLPSLSAMAPLFLPKGNFQGCARLFPTNPSLFFLHLLFSSLLFFLAVGGRPSFFFFFCMHGAYGLLTSLSGRCRGNRRCLVVENAALVFYLRGLHGSFPHFSPRPPSPLGRDSFIY